MSQARVLSGVCESPAGVCPRCGASEDEGKVRALKFEDEEGWWSQCLPCRDRIAAKTPSFTNEGWWVDFPADELRAMQSGAYYTGQEWLDAAAKIWGGATM